MAIGRGLESGAQARGHVVVHVVVVHVVVVHVVGVWRSLEEHTPAKLRDLETPPQLEIPEI